MLSMDMLKDIISYDLVDNVPRCPGSARGGGAFLFQGGGQTEHHRQA